MPDIAEDTRDRLTDRVSVRITPIMRRRFEALAAKTDRSVSDFIRLHLFRPYLARAYGQGGRP